MIFLAVSGALMGSAMALISGQEEKTRFAQSVRTFEQDLQDIFNDVSTGYYAAASPENVDFTCSSDDAGLVNIGPGGTAQGKNHGCVFLGKIIKFDVGSADYSVYTLVNSTNAVKFDEISGKLLGTPATDTQGIVDTSTIQADMEVTKIVTKNPLTDVKGIALISDFGTLDEVSGNRTGNAARLTVHEYTGGYANNLVTPASLPLTNGGTLICLQQPGVGGRKASVSIGSTGISTIDTVIDGWDEECDS